jgi:coproporphyrinogen III oxidase-like Fe-S oxidoreductase
LPLKYLITGNRGRLSLQCRFEAVTPAFIDAVRRHPASITLEFGLQTAQPDEWQIIDRPNHLERVREVMRQLNTAGVHYEVSLIYGLPRQTLASFRATLAFCRQNGAPVIRAFPLMLLRGTPLYEAKKALGLVESCDVPGADVSTLVGSRIPHVIASPSFTFREWRQMHDLAAEANAGAGDDVN